MHRQINLAVLIGISLCWNDGVASADPAGDALAQLFLEHMESNVPIAGDFEIRGQFDPGVEAWRAERYPKAIGPYRIQMEKDNRLLRCRWAWDGSTEMTEPLEGTENTYLHMVTSPEGTVKGTNPNSYNLTAPGTETGYRPGNFYSMASNGKRWPESLEGYEFRREDRADELTTLVGTKGGTEYRFLVDPSSGVLRGYERFWEGKLLARSSITSYRQGPGGRIFPDQAKIEIFVSAYSTDRPYRTESLTALEVRFPNSADATRRELVTEIPTGALVADRELDRFSRLNQPIRAESLLAGDLPSPQRLPNEDNGIPSPEELLAVANRGWSPWLVGVLVACAVLLVGGLVHRWWGRRQQVG